MACRGLARIWRGLGRVVVCVRGRMSFDNSGSSSILNAQRRRGALLMLMLMLMLVLLYLLVVVVMTMARGYWRC